MTKITGISSMATRQILADLSRLYEQRASCTVAVRAMGGVEAAGLVRAGERTDVVVLALNVMEKLESEGHLHGESCIDFARSGIAVAVPTGTRHPNIRDEAAVRDAMLAARKVCYSTGPSGDHLQRLWERWGIVDELAPRLLQSPPGVPVGTLVARGEADFGLQQLSELMHVPGIDVVGPLPPAVQAVTVFTTAIASVSTRVDAARAFNVFLTSPDADAVKRRHGMEPA